MLPNLETKNCFSCIIDSLMYDIETEDVFKDFSEHKDLFDFSGYPTTHPLHSDKNKKVLGDNSGFLAHVTLVYLK